MPRDSRIPVAAALAVAAIALYWPVTGHPFLSYDDDLYVTGNARVRAGLTADGFRWAFASLEAANWHPLTWLSHMLDVELFGMAAGRHHLVNALFHAANAILLFLLLLRTTGAARRSAFVAALFALHPLHVESVAWVAERKDVLSAFLGFLSLIAWSHYASRPSPGRYLAVFLLLALGLMAKPMLVTFPVLFLLLDFWPLGRLVRAGDPAGFPWRRLGRLALEKAPLLALSGASAAVTLVAQAAGGTVVSRASFPVGARVANALVSYAAYAFKSVLPLSLAVFYPRPPAGLPAWQVAGASLFLAAVTAAAIREAGRRPWLAFGWGWFLVSLLPVIGLVQAGHQAMADRYAYIPLTGLLVIFSWGLSPLAERAGAGRAAAAAALLLAAAALAARGEIAHWRSNEALFGRALEVTEGNWLAHYNLGVEAERARDPGRAAGHYRAALASEPGYAPALTNLGGLLLAAGRRDEAMPLLAEAVRIAPGAAKARNNLAMALAQAGRHEEAVSHYREASRLKPDDADVRCNLGVALEDSGRPGEAEAEYREAIRLDPGSAPAHNNLGLLLGRTGRPDEGAAHLREALRLDPGDAEARARLERMLRGLPADAAGAGNGKGSR